MNVRVTLKLATSLDGKIALADGQSEWITGEKARRKGRALRAEHDAIAIGSNTAVIDNPQLTTRLGDLPDPMRVVFDTRLRLDPQSNLARTADEVPTVALCGPGHEAGELRELGVSVVEAPLDGDHVALEPALSALHRMGVRTLLVEGGGRLAAAFLMAGLVDRLEWFTAPKLIGGDGRDCVAAMSMRRMSDVLAFRRTGLQELDDDLHESFEAI